MKREILGLSLFALVLVAAACSQSERPTGPSSSAATGVNVLASIADEVIGDARNQCPSDVPRHLTANANNGKVDFANTTVANVTRYVYRIEIRDSFTDQWRAVRSDYTHDGKPLFTMTLAKGFYRVSVRTPCMAAGVWSAPFEFSTP